MWRRWPARLIGLVACVGGCSSDHATNAGGGSATVSAVVARANPVSSLSAVVTFTVRSADSARARYRTAGDTEQMTPYPPVFDGSASVTVLGLRPGTPYQLSVEAVGHDGTIATSATTQLMTVDLPALQGVTLQVTGTLPGGYLVTAVNRDSEGFIVGFRLQVDIACYRGFPLRSGDQAQETKQATTGDFTVFVGASFGWQPNNGRYIEVRTDGEVVRTIAASAVLTGDESSDQRARLFGYDLRHVDMTAYGGPADALIAGHTIMHKTKTGGVEVFWSAWDHFATSDWIEPPNQNKQLANIDFDHPNSLDFDPDGNYVISFRNLGEVRKIDAMTGAVLWRLGCAHNQFAFLNDSLNGFSGQHSVRVLQNGDLLMHDDGLRHNPPQSRAVEYRWIRRR